MRLLCDMMFMHCKDVMFTLQTDLQNRNGGAHQILRGDTHLVTAVANDDVGIGVLRHHFHNQHLYVRCAILIQQLWVGLWNCHCEERLRAEGS